MSRFGDLEASCLARLATVGALAQTKIVPAGLLEMTRPEVWPAGVVSIISAKRQGEELQIASHTTRMFRVDIAIVIWANSDGVTLGDARLSAWSIADAAMDAFAGFVPIVTGAVVWPVQAGEIQNVSTDAGQAGVYIPLTVDIQWTT